MKYYTKHGARTPTCTINKFDPTCTDASFEKECRIDRIIYKYTHNLPLENYQRSMLGHQYIDTSVIPKDPEEMAKYFDDINAQFMQVPADIRREYGDNAFAFAQAVSAQDFEKSDAAKRLNDAINKNRKILNPTLEEMFERNAKERQDFLSDLKSVITKKDVPKNEA